VPRTVGDQLPLGDRSPEECLACCWTGRSSEAEDDGWAEGRRHEARVQSHVIVLDSL